MSHEILQENGKAKAIYARKPAWHRLGHVKEEGWFTADEALAVLNPNKTEVIKVTAGAWVVNGKGEREYVESDDQIAVVRFRDDGTPQILSFMSQDYGVVQIEDQFRFLDEVVGNIGGAHYETAGLLRKGKQVFMTIDTGAIVLDPGERADTVQKYILGVNSYDGSMAFRVKMTNIRVECANLLACALRGSNDRIVEGDWSTRHTKDIMSRTEAAKRTLGLWVEYNDIWLAQATEMIQTPLLDDTFHRLLSDLFTTEKELGVKETNEEAVETVKTIYELSPTCANVFGTVWGGLQAVTEFHDWRTKVRGGKNTDVNEARLRRQLEGKDSDAKQAAWDRFYDWSVENPRPKLVGV